MIETNSFTARRILLRIKDKRGQTLVEYALIIAIISVVAISTLLGMGSQVKGVFSTVTSQMALSQTAGSSSGSGSGSGSGGPPPHGGG